MRFSWSLRGLRTLAARVLSREPSLRILSEEPSLRILSEEPSLSTSWIASLIRFLPRVLGIGESLTILVEDLVVFGLPILDLALNFSEEVYQSALSFFKRGSWHPLH